MFYHVRGTAALQQSPQIDLLIFAKLLWEGERLKLMVEVLWLVPEQACDTVS